MASALAGGADAWKGPGLGHLSSTGDGAVVILKILESEHFFNDIKVQKEEYDRFKPANSRARTRCKPPLPGARASHDFTPAA